MSAGAKATEMVRDIVTRLSYKPGTSFVVDPDASSIHDPAVYVDASLAVLDSVPPHDADRGGFVVVIPEEIALADAGGVLALVRDGLVRFEAHEVDEFLRFDGVRLTDPHPRSGDTGVGGETT